ncbi:MAG TPA: 4-hydroxy-tetrahydrodipicolinate reductase [Dehalococcoidia bacterium]|nr:4-hydroxy-tetrahydrodipicolinate reductase [Dehalococcoidia bacterium]
MAIRVAVSGTGRMGREVLAALCREEDLEPVAVLSRSAQEEYLPLPDGSGLVPFGSEPLPLFQRVQPQVVVDFTHADFTPKVARAALEVEARPVIGTSGLSESFLEELREECRRRRLGAIVAPNFAIGGVLMVHLARVAARFFDAAEIIEMHHDQKADAPSGTALATARAMLQARGGPFRRPATQRENLPGTRGGHLEGITIHSVRLPGLVAHQEVVLGGPGQVLTIRHDSTSRESFVPGVLLAVRRVLELDGLVVGLEALLGLE